MLNNKQLLKQLVTGNFHVLLEGRCYACICFIINEIRSFLGQDFETLNFLDPTYQETMVNDITIYPPNQELRDSFTFLPNVDRLNLDNQRQLLDQLNQSPDLKILSTSRSSLIALEKRGAFLPDLFAKLTQIRIQVKGTDAKSLALSIDSLSGHKTEKRSRGVIASSPYIVANNPAHSTTRNGALIGANNGFEELYSQVKEDAVQSRYRRISEALENHAGDLELAASSLKISLEQAEEWLTSQNLRPHFFQSSQADKLQPNKSHLPALQPHHSQSHPDYFDQQTEHDSRWPTAIGYLVETPLEA